MKSAVSYSTQQPGSAGMPHPTINLIFQVLGRANPLGEP